jgi:hypothetical protein
LEYAKFSISPANVNKNLNNNYIGNNTLVTNGRNIYNNLPTEPPDKDYSLDPGGLINDDPLQQYFHGGIVTVNNVNEIPSSAIATQLVAKSVPLLRFKAKINGVDCIVMIDSGANCDFISESFMEKLKQLGKAGVVHKSNRLVRLADGTTHAVGGLTGTAVQLLATDGTAPVFANVFTITKLQNHDAILSLSWLTEYEIDMKWKQRMFSRIRKDGTKVVCKAIPADYAVKETSPVLLNPLPAPGTSWSSLDSSDSFFTATRLTTPTTVSSPSSLDKMSYNSFRRDHLISRKELSRRYKTGEQMECGLIMMRPTKELPSLVDNNNSSVIPSSREEAECVKATDQLLKEFKDVFPDTLPAGVPPVRNNIYHKIDLIPGSVPPSRPSYRQSIKELDELKQQLTEFIDKGFIRPSESSFGAPILFVKKSDGSLRFCVDYRLLNNITIKNKTTLPLVDDLFDRVQGAKYFTKIDLRTGFYQIPVAPEDIHKTAMNTRYGHFEWVVLPMGMTNAPATFQTLMHNTFHDYLDQFVLSFLDDILIYSKTLNEHNQHVRLVLQRLREKKLYGKLSKCEFFKKEVEFLGHKISDKGLHVMESKVQSIKDWPIPSNVSDVRSFYGLCSYYRKFIPGFSKVATPLSELYRKEIPFKWSEEQTNAFNKLKSLIISAPVLLIPDPKLPYVIHCDASGYAVGAVLLQDQGNGLQPCAFMSKKMHPAETRYPVHEQELLAIICCLGQWRCYLNGAIGITIRTDHNSLKHFQTQPLLSNRQARWKDKIAEFDFKIEYVEGKTNVVADALSRRSDHQPIKVVSSSSSNELLLSHILTDECTEEEYYLSVTELNAGTGTAASGASASSSGMGSSSSSSSSSSLDTSLRIRLVLSSPSFIKLMVDAASKDQDYVRRLNSIQEKKHQSIYSFTGVTAKDGLLIRDNKIIVPNDNKLKTLIINEIHDTPMGGHLGKDKTIAAVKKNFYWLGMDSVIEKYVTTCDSCQRNKSSNQSPMGQLMPLPIPQQQCVDWSMDMIGPLHKSKSDNDTIVVMIDRGSKLVHYAACKSTIDSPGLANIFIDNVIKHHGIPSSIVSDRGPQFDSSWWKQFYLRLGTNVKLTTAYHPQSDGQTENANKTLEQYLRSFVNDYQDNWDVCLSMAEFAINNSKHISTGYSPFQLVYSHPVNTPIDVVVKPFKISDNASASDKVKVMKNIWDDARERLIKSQDRQSYYANQHRRDVKLNIGEKVLLSTNNLKLKGPPGASHKLQGKYIGPFEVIEIVNNNAYKLKLPSSLKLLHPVFNLDRLKIYKHNSIGLFPSRPDLSIPPSSYEIDDEGNKWWEVEKILGKRVNNRNKVSYLVQWKNYPLHEAEWRPVNSLGNCKEVIQEFNDRQL